MSKKMKDLREKQEEQLDQLLSTRRWCYVIPLDGHVEGHGFRVSIAIENKKGHYPTGDLATLSDDKKTRNDAFRDGKSVPWFWGDTYEDACKICDEQNARLGYSIEEAMKIVASSMGGR